MKGKKENNTPLASLAGPVSPESRGSAAGGAGRRLPRLLGAGPAAAARRSGSRGALPGSRVPVPIPLLAVPCRASAGRRAAQRSAAPGERRRVRGRGLGCGGAGTPIRKFPPPWAVPAAEG